MPTDRTSRTRWLSPSLAAMALLTASACTSVGPEARTGTETAAPGMEALEFDEFLPALDFDQSGAPHVLSGQGGLSSIDILGPIVVHASEQGLRAHNVVDDTPMWITTTEHGGTTPRSVRTVEHSDTVLAIATFETRIPGEGTSRDRLMSEVLAVDLFEGETLWHIVAEAEGGFSGRIIGAANDSVILSDQGAHSLVLKDGSHSWSEPHVTPRFVDESGVLVATSEDSDTDLYDVHRLHGIDVDTGERLWETWEEGDHATHSQAARNEYSDLLDTDPDPGEMVMAHGSLNGYQVQSVRSAGPGRFYAIASYSRNPWDRDTRGGTIALFDTATGIADFSINHDPLTADSAPRLGWGEATCGFDGTRNVTCWAEDPGLTLVNIDAVEGEVLWVEWFSHDSERRPIKPVSTNNGVLYATITDLEAWEKPIILDLEDGSDLVLNPGAAPVMTNGSIAIEPAEGREGFHAYPVTG